MTRHHSCRVSPFGHPRIHARLTAPRGITQPPTSFIGSQCQGIHHAPLNTYNTTQFRRNCIDNHQTNVRRPSRCSQPLSTNQTPHPTTKAGRQPNQPPPPGEGNTTPGFPQRDEEVTGLLSQSPIVCLMISHMVFPHHIHVCCAPEPHPLQVRSIHRIAAITELPHDVGGP